MAQHINSLALLLETTSHTKGGPFLQELGSSSSGVHGHGFCACPSNVTNRSKRRAMLPSSSRSHAHWDWRWSPWPPARLGARLWGLGLLKLNRQTVGEMIDWVPVLVVGLVVVCVTAYLFLDPKFRTSRKDR